MVTTSESPYLIVVVPVTKTDPPSGEHATEAPHVDWPDWSDRDGVVTVQYKRRWSWAARNVRADFTVNTGIPWDIEIAGGANKVQGKLTNVELSSLELTGGVNQLRLVLGHPRGDVPIRLPSGNQIRIERPAGTAILLRVSGGAANVEFDGMKLGAVGRPTLESSGASNAADRYSVEISGGVARIVVVEVR